MKICFLTEQRYVDLQTLMNFIIALTHLSDDKLKGQCHDIFDPFLIYIKNSTWAPWEQP